MPDKEKKDLPSNDVDILVKENADVKEEIKVEYTENLPEKTEHKPVERGF